MKLLLDSHSFLWFVAGDDRLSVRAREAIEDVLNVRQLSLASVWELAIKHSLGRLQLTPGFSEFITTEARRNSIEICPVVASHVMRVAELPFHHRDPFDRLLAAQCLVEGWSLVSRDKAMEAYGLKRIW